MGAKFEEFCVIYYLSTAAVPSVVIVYNQNTGNVTSTRQTPSQPQSGSLSELC